MSNPFEQATIDMMTNPDFGEVCYIGGSTVGTTCVCSELTEAAVITEFGDDDGESFYLRIEARLLSTPPKKYDKITFRNVTYKIDRIDLDSAGLVYRVYLKSLSSRSS
jgi:hypothetical protein